MMELKIGYDDAHRQARLRRNTLAIAITICCPLVMVGLLLLLPKDGEIAAQARWLVPVGIFAFCAACFYYAARLGTERMNLTTTYLFTGTELIRRRSGWPDDRIALKDIDSVTHKHGRIVVTSALDQRGFIIPEKFEGFASLLHELDKLGRVEARPRPMLLGVSVAVTLACCLLTVLFSHKKSTVEIAGVLGTGLLAYSSYQLLRVRKGPEQKAVKSALWLLVGLAWAATLFLLYSSILHVD